MGFIDCIFRFLSSFSSIFNPWVISRFNVKRSWYGFGKSRKCDNVSLSVSKSEQGTANGLLNMVFPIGHILVPVVIMPLYIISPEIPYILLSTLAILLIIFILLNQKRYFIVEKI